MTTEDNSNTFFTNILYKIQRTINFRGLAEIGVGKNAGNLNLSADLKWQAFKNINIQGEAKIIRYDPYINQRSAYVTEQLIFENDFGKVNELLLGGRINFSGLGLSAGFKSGILDRI